MARMEAGILSEIEGINRIFAEQGEPLLKTKFFIPSIRPKRVERQSLIEKMNSNLDKALILISAPAGFGKTEVLAEWVAQARLPVAWLTIDSEDNDVHHFLRYMIAALKTCLAKHADAVCKTSAAMLHSVPFPPLQTNLVAFVNDLADISTPLAIVLDDYQWISSPAVNEALTFILEHLPPQVHFFITSRVDPSIPLHRLRAAQRMLEIRTEDLRFSRDETDAFMNVTMGLGLSPHDISTLDSRIEGWIVGLQMAALSMQSVIDRSAYVHALSGSHRYILEYLVEEVLNQQPENIQAFLLQTSILERLCGPLCDAVLGEDGRSQSILEYLDHANLFITPLDMVGCWYRYHYLFANLLQARLRQSKAGLIPTLHSRAAMWLKQNGINVGSINHAMAAGDINLVEDLVEGRTLAMMDQGEWQRLEKWIDSLPPEQVSQRPWLCIAQAWIMINTGLLNPAEGYLQRAEESYQSLKDRLPKSSAQRLAGYISALRAYIATLQEDTEQAFALAHTALASLPGFDLSIRTLAVRVEALSLRLQGNIVAADQALSQVTNDALAAEDSYTAATLLGDQVLNRISQGKLRSAYAISQRAIQLGEDYKRLNGYPLFAMAYVYPRLACVYLEWNQLPAAAHYAKAGLDLCQEWGSLGVWVDNYISMAMVLLASQDADGALDMIHKAQEASVSLSNLHAEVLRRKRMCILLKMGQRTEVEQWLGEKKFKPDDQPNIKDTEDYVVLARNLIDRGQLEPACSILAKLKQAYMDKKLFNGDLLEILVLQAISLKTLGKMNQAIEVLDEAIGLAEAEGFVRAFVGEGKPMEELLEIYHHKGGTKDYSDKLLKAFKVTPGKLDDLPGTPPGLSLLVEPLTEREVEVLNLLSAGLTNQEIAKQLYLSKGTIKTHTHNIYGKLGVKSRTQAIARAKELNLL